MKCGLGTASITMQETGLVVGAIVAVNGVGDVIDPKTGHILAGSRTPDGKRLLNSMAQLLKGNPANNRTGENSTIGVVVTNAALNKSEATKIAQMAHDGLARSINPIHTPFDGDAIFAAGTGTSKSKADLTTIGSIAAEVMARAVCRAATTATGIPGYPAARDLQS
jgi:L-aminopeptidase/D-esterase-like protein